MEGSPVPEQLSPSWEAENGHHVGPEVAILFLGMSLILGICCGQLVRDRRVPYTVALLLVGVGLGALEYGTKQGLGVLGESIRMWANMDGDLILFIFLPVLLFESSFAFDVHYIKRCMLQIVLLAGPGVVISTFSLGVVNRYLLPYGWNWSTSLLLGGLLGATDPVAVVALLKELGASKKLSTIIEAESLVNDGVAIVIYRLFMRMTLGQSFSAGRIIGSLSQVSLGAVTLGLAVGLVSIIWLRTVKNNTLLHIALSVAASYMAFFAAEHGGQVSGILTVMTVGIFFAAFGRKALTQEHERSLHHLWEVIAYIANTLIFILSGVIIAESILRNQDSIDGSDWGYLVMLYVFVQLSRLLLVFLLYPGLRYFGYGLNWKEAVVIMWSGLRGAVSLSLSLLVAQAGPSEYLYLSRKTQAQFVFLTGGVVFMTIVINGSTTQFLLSALGLVRPSETMGLMLRYAKSEMYRKGLEVFRALSEDQELGPVDWGTIKKYLCCLKGVSDAELSVHPHESRASTLALHKEPLQEARLRFLSSVRAAYWKMLDEGRITQTVATILMRSVDEALEDLNGLHDWKGIHPQVHFPRFLKNFQREKFGWIPEKFLQTLLNERLELGCCISAAFLTAHQQVQLQLLKFIDHEKGDPAVAEAVISESEMESEEAKQFLEDIRVPFPQVLSAVRFKQVAHAILMHLNGYVGDVEKVGELGEKEILKLRDSLEIDMKRLMRPVSVVMPSAVELLSSQFFIEALPPRLQEPLLRAAKKKLKSRGCLLYKEKSGSDGIWFITSGTLKWSSNALKGRSPYRSTFHQGSVLGLYETLAGMPHLCDVTAESLVHCLFVGKTEFLSLLQSEQALEDLFWQESALVVAKIQIPQCFDGVTMHDLRAVTGERGQMRKYVSGEVIELRCGDMGILLEGVLKPEGSPDMIGAPACLVSELYASTYDISGPSIHKGMHFHVDTAARTLFFQHNVLSCSSFFRPQSTLVRELLKPRNFLRPWQRVVNQIEQVDPNPRHEHMTKKVAR